MKTRIVSERFSNRISQLFRFGIVGVMGLGWDTASVYTLRPLLGLGCATIAAYFVAATANWLCNRVWTFRDSQARHHFLMQWLRFIAGNTVGFCLNRGCVFLLFHFFPICRVYPFMALAAGALSGMTANFHISRRYVFQCDAKDTEPSGSPESMPESQPSRTPDDGVMTIANKNPGI
ncbi:GtrA family protein [Novacetimonas pomaceti]|uniref:GtrA family protein n=1 Tax=Novacetimonas pomaceti TaxID=2021998 RepID=UPI001C2DD6C3|nr:GtrA family protein [Novacetimonas pomaceti]MBV1835496.1 GtrA family protein [Novacetimonas pomaceti]